ncbi:hypothetical protein [Bacteroides pyogenes]|uniref:hypothetical protein n=1 Tax=Bacteroides pyogenes TaxID=310300 RepID=UPI0011C06532|nr:hypothetical protein [Bacteroides pyogenes]MBB3895635.1 hypothetical protein [Bacteroides pyogenes]
MNKITYPLPLLEDFVANDYKSIEQKRFDKQIEENERHHKGFICVDTVFFDWNLCFFRCKSPAKEGPAMQLCGHTACLYEF